MNFNPFRRGRGRYLPNGEHEIVGHPGVDAYNLAGQKMRISVCAECGSIRSVLYLSRDRWFCRNCRMEGDARPTQVPISNPTRR